MTRRSPRDNGPHTVAIGAAVLLATMVAVIVSIQATNGLPFIPVYTLNLRVPDAAQVTKNADVTIAGYRVGQVLTITAVRGPAGLPEADIKLAIDKRYGPLPVDSRFAITLAGTLGAKVIEVTPGHSSQMFADGAIVPETQAVPRPVDPDQILDSFNAGARAGARASLIGFGTGFAGRGADLNTAISELVPLTSNLTPVMKGYAAASTGLDRFVAAASNLMGQLAPVARTQAELVRALAQTFGALAPTEPALAAAIARSPATLSDSTASLKQTNPFLSATTTFLADLRPAAAELPSAAPALARALGAGVRNLPASSTLSARTVTALDAFERFAVSAPTRPGIERLALTFSALQPLLAFLTPAQTTCNYPALLLRNLASMFKDHISTGTLARAGGVVIGVATNSERGPSTTYYTGPVAHALGPLHWNPYPYTDAPGQPDSCEAGHEPYIQSRAVIGNVPVKTPGSTESAVNVP